MLTIKDLSYDEQIISLNKIFKDIEFYKQQKDEEKLNKELELMVSYCQHLDTNNITKKYIGKPLSYVGVKILYTEMIKYLTEEKEKIL